MNEQPPEWNDRYQTDDLPWETGKPSTELQKVLGEYGIPAGRALEMGCGTGNSAIFLAGKGFDVTAFDLSAIAVDRARAKAADAGVKVNLLAADIEKLPDLGSPFEFVFDRGFYHVVRRNILGVFTDVLARVCAPGGYYLTLAGNANEVRPGERGPPRVSAPEICSELAGFMELVQLREFRFEPPQAGGGPGRALAWSALFRRKS